MEPGLKFAVVREDPQTERTLIQAEGARSVLLVASGGCTALSLEAVFPELEIVAFDINPRQLQHLKDKRAAARRGESVRLNVGDSNIHQLNQRGAFEGIFRILRSAMLEFVSSAEEIDHFFSSAEQERRAIAEAWCRSPYWPAVFSTAFNGPVLHAMFGPAATQHAEPGSYPGYFQRVFERGLARGDAAQNSFLQHVLLGAYCSEDAPEYIRMGRNLPSVCSMELVTGTIFDVPRLDRFDLLSLSNVFDWSDDQQISEWLSWLSKRVRVGSRLLIRQLNNQRDLRPWLEPAFELDEPTGARLLEADRSLFYERILVAVRVE